MSVPAYRGFLVELAAVRAPSWRDRAECAGVPLTTFFPLADRGGSEWDEARAICDRCPVLGECRDAADAEERGQSFTLTRKHGYGPWGMRGGEAPNERRSRRRRAQRAAS